MYLTIYEFRVFVVIYGSHDLKHVYKSLKSTYIIKYIIKYDSNFDKFNKFVAKDPGYQY